MSNSDLFFSNCQLNLIRAQGLLNHTVHRILNYIESDESYKYYKGLYDQALEIHKVSSKINDILDDLLKIEHPLI